ncbi:hypothetical protein NPIL_580501 [Nephila pilipes]|uniref:Uncharacterized protein n=1 Tax=Nephila pilipes TaxID=299642 RepID=A0A8X6NPR3_NEPPI|nr:hypothetical protein NPIL_580501 [Nephila pilipes]
MAYQFPHYHYGRKRCSRHGWLRSAFAANASTPALLPYAKRRWYFCHGAWHLCATAQHRLCWHAVYQGCDVLLMARAFAFTIKDSLS